MISFFRFSIFFKVTCLNVPLKEGLGKQHDCLFPKVTGTVRSTTPYFAGEVGGQDEHLQRGKHTHERVCPDDHHVPAVHLMIQTDFSPASCLCHFQATDTKIGVWPRTQRNLGGFESEWLCLDLPVNTVASSTVRDFSYDSFWRCLLLLLCGCYNGLIL